MSSISRSRAVAGSRLSWGKIGIGGGYDRLVRLLGSGCRQRLPAAIDTLSAPVCVLKCGVHLLKVESYAKQSALSQELTLYARIRYWKTLTDPRTGSARS